MRRLLWRLGVVAPLVTTALVGTPTVTPVAAATSASSTCQFLTPSGQPSPIKHVIHIQFDNVHFTRDLPNVPSDLEQMPHLLNFIEQNGTMLANEHTPLIAHTADDLVTGLTGVYGNQHGLPVSNSFEVYDNSAIGSYNTSAFTYWSDRLPKPNMDGQQPITMVDSSGNNLLGPWVPFVNAGCNVADVSTANMALESSADAANVVGSAGDTNLTTDYVGLAVHCADVKCSTVGNGAGTEAQPELVASPPGTTPQGFGALYGHKNIATQVPNITQTDGTPITGFNVGFDPSPQWTLGYMEALLKANVPVVYGYVADAHDSRANCTSTKPSSPVVSNAVTPTDPTKACGAYAPGEPGYVAQLKQWDDGFQQFFDQLNSIPASQGGPINPSNTLFVIHSDENDHYAGSLPINQPCDGVTTPCLYDRLQLGELTTDLPLLLQQQHLYDFGGSLSRPGFGNTDVPYGIDFDTAPGFWLKGHPANGSPQLRKLEGALAAVKSQNPYSGLIENVFNYFVDQPGLQALHMVTSDNDRTPGVVGFGEEDHYIQTSPLISTNSSTGAQSSFCNVFPGPHDATCLDNGFIWLHGDYAPDINNTWAALVGPGVNVNGVDTSVWTDHADLRPTLMNLVCLKDDYTHEGRPVLQVLNNSALPDSVQNLRGPLTTLGDTFKQINAPVGEFGKDAIQISTQAIKSDEGRYSSIDNRLQNLVTRRDALATEMESVLDTSGASDTMAGCGGVPSGVTARRVQDLNDRGQQLLAEIQRLAADTLPR